MRSIWRILTADHDNRLARGALAVFVVTAMVLSGAGLVLSHQYKNTVQQNERFSQYETFLEDKIASLEDEVGLLADEVKSRQAVYRQMISILEAHGTDIPVTKRQDFIRFVYHESMKNDLDPILAMAVIKVESTFETTAVSSMGAVGLMQVLPYVGEYKARQLGIAWNGKSTLYDPFTNVRIGLAYLMELTEQFGDFQLALEAYNRGPSALRATMTAGINPSRTYARRVLRAYTRFQKI